MDFPVVLFFLFSDGERWRIWIDGCVDEGGRGDFSPSSPN